MTGNEAHGPLDFYDHVHIYIYIKIAPKRKLAGAAGAGQVSEAGGKRQNAKGAFLGDEATSHVQTDRRTVQRLMKGQRDVALTDGIGRQDPSAAGSRVSLKDN